MFSRNKLHRSVSLLVCLSMIIATASGCRKEKKVDYKPEAIYTLEEIRDEIDQSKINMGNMDFSKADIVIPDGSEIEELIFPLPARDFSTFASIKEKFYENITRLTGGQDVDENSVEFKLQTMEDAIPIQNVEESYFDTVREEGGYYLSYHEPEHSMLLYTSTYMCEIAGENVAKASGGEDSWAGYRMEEGIEIDGYDIPEDSIQGVSYKVGGQDVALEEAVAYVEQTIGEEYHFVSSPYLQYKVFHVDVVKLKEDSYYYKMQLKALYEGISFSFEQGADVTAVDGQEDTYQNVSESHTLLMMADRSIDYVWSSLHTYEQKDSGETYTHFLSIRSAMQLLSETVSASTKLVCDKVELLYRTEMHFDADEMVDSVQCHPVYQFKFTNTGLPEYPVLFFNVDAVSGKIEATNDGKM